MICTVVGEVAWLRVARIDRRGAVLDWGRAEDLVLPRGEWVGRVRTGQSCLVMVSTDRDDRPVATMKLDTFVEDESAGLSAGDAVSLVIADPTDLRVNAVVNDRYWGLLYADELFRAVTKGQRLDGWIKAVRPDHKLDLTLHAPGYAAVDLFTDELLTRLKHAGGFLPLSDRSAPEAIYRTVGVSKKRSKQGVGALYKRRRITLEDGGIRLVPGTEGP